MEEVHLRVLDTENMEHGHPSRGKRDNHRHEDQSAVTSVAGNNHHHEDQSAVTTIIIIMKTRELLANTGNSSLKMAASMGVVRPWHH